MKLRANKGFLLSALFAFAADAQPPGNAEIVSRLTADLIPLKAVLISEEPLEDAVYSPDELRGLESVGQYKVMQACQRDLLPILISHTRGARRPEDASIAFGSFFSPDLAYKLTRALAGKDLTELNVRPLSEGIIGMNESALDCSIASCQLQDSAAFRSSAQRTWDALHVLGVEERDLRIVTAALFRGAKAAASPPVRATYK
jgi:hypothetical protein